MAMAYTREPLACREVVIIHNLKKVMKMPVTHIAQAVGRNKTSVYKALKQKVRAGRTPKLCRRGRPQSMSLADKKSLVKTLLPLVLELRQ